MDHRANFRAGWLKDKADHRDYDALTLLQAFGKAAHPNLPRRVSLRGMLPGQVEQLAEGCCVWNSIARLIQFTEMRELNVASRPLPARDFGYYNGRVIQQTVGEDSGLSIRIGMQAAIKSGYCEEGSGPGQWPYGPATFLQKPNAAAYAAALPHALKGGMYAKVRQNAQAMMQVLASNHPFVIGFTCRNAIFHVGSDGIVPNPGWGDPIAGGHAVLVTGYDMDSGLWEFENWWGAGWGNTGYGYLHSSYLLNQQEASDFWTIVMTPKPALAAA